MTEPLETSGPKEEAVGVVGGKQHASLSTKKDGCAPSKPREIAIISKIFKSHPPMRIHTSQASHLGKEENGGTPVCYLERAAVRREQCGMSAESRNSAIRRDVR
jgi:hypothetical protein